MISIPEFYEPSLIINLFDELCQGLKDGFKLNTNLSDAFSKKKKVKKTKTIQEHFFDFIEQQLNINNLLEINDSHCPFFNIEIQNSAVVLGKTYL